MKKDQKIKAVFKSCSDPAGSRRAVREARPTEGDGPDEGGSAFFDRKSEVWYIEKNTNVLSKSAQSPQVVGAAGRTAFSLVLSFGQQKKVQMP